MIERSPLDIDTFQKTENAETLSSANCLCALPTPQGDLVLTELPQGTGAALPPELATRLLRAKEEGPALAWLLRLGAVEEKTPLPAEFAYWRAVASQALSYFCRAGEPNLLELSPPAEVVARLADACPPMQGSEYVNASFLSRLWVALGETLRRHSARAGLSPRAYLESQGSAWSQVGRVFFHLAENPNDSQRPFAFLATYTEDATPQGRPKHRPIGQAVQALSSRPEWSSLETLLAPLRRAASRSAWVKSLLDLGDIFQPLAWSPEEAHKFLSDLPVIEAAGIQTKVPSWWSERPKPTARVVIGEKALGDRAYLDFKLSLALGGEELSQSEWEALRQQHGHLVKLKGKWIEVDAEKLKHALDQFQQLEKDAKKGGLTFFEGMRLLAGMKAREVEEETGSAWSEVRAGDWMERILEGLKDPSQLQSALVTRAIQGLQANLRPYQIEGVRWLFFLSRLGLGSCLADDMGLGKTLQVLGLFLAAREVGQRRHLVVAPSSLLANWRQEIARFAPDLTHQIAHPNFTSSAKELDAAARGQSEVTITSYAMLPRLAELQNVFWDVVVLDEAQAIKNASTKAAKAAKMLQAQARVALTGTPIENHLSDLWSIFDFLNPGLLGGSTQFQSFARKAAQTPETGYRPLRTLLRPYLLRRLKTDKSIINDLPDKTEIKAYCTLTKMQAALYQTAVDELQAHLSGAEGLERRGIILKYLIRFKQICNHPTHLLKEGDFALEQSGKFARLAELVETFAERQEKVLLFTQFQEITQPLATFLRGLFGRSGLVLDGQTPVHERPKLVTRFQEDPQVPFFVLSLKAGGSGLNLTAATQVIHFDRWWNPAVENQATDRAYRIGQKKNVLVHKFICRGTLEDKIDALLESKQRLSDEVLSEAESPMLTEMSNEELLRTVSLDLRSALEEEERA